MRRLGNIAIVLAIAAASAATTAVEPGVAAGGIQCETDTGDVVRTGDGASVTIALADQTVVEVAEVSSFTVGSRDRRGVRRARPPEIEVKGGIDVTSGVKLGG